MAYKAYSVEYQPSPPPSPPPFPTSRSLHCFHLTQTMYVSFHLFLQAVCFARNALSLLPGLQNLVKFYNKLFLYPSSGLS